MRRISVILEDLEDEALSKIMNINGCSITDAVSLALVAFAHENTEPVMIAEETPLSKIHEACKKAGTTFEEWTESRGIDKDRLRYLIKRCEAGSTVWGFGNTRKGNKWRDKKKDTEFKTHTSWIAHCLKEDLGIDVV